MKTIRTVAAAAAVLALGAYFTQAIQPKPQPPPDTPLTYQVTPWPSDDAAKPYHQHVEEYLNKMASQGWTFRTDLVGQRERMMVFERGQR